MIARTLPMAWVLTIAGLSACAHEPPQGAESNDQRKAHWQKYAENYGEIDLSRVIADVFNSMLGYSGDCDIHLIQRPRSAIMRLRFVRDDREILAFSVEVTCVFRDSNNVLYFGHYIDSKAQRSVAAYDLETGKTLWRTVLTNQHFATFNREGQFTVQLREDVVFIAGKESTGRYIEIFDQKTGQRLAYHAVPAVSKYKPKVE